MTPNEFYGPAITLPFGSYSAAAKELNVEPAALLAILQIESSRGAYLPDGRPVILFEAHIFSRLTGNQFDDTHPDISTKSWDRNSYGAPGSYQYERLTRAMQLDETAALKACSWGFWQCMGFNHEVIGYETVQEMVEAFVESEHNQLQGFLTFLRTQGIVPALRAKDWHQVGYKYNGPRYRENRYAEKLAEAYAANSSNILRLGSEGPRVVSLQRLLVKHNLPVSVDGAFGRETEEAVRIYQEAQGLTVDGVVGPQTFQMLAESRIGEQELSKSKRVKGSLAIGGVGIVGLFETVRQSFTEVQTIAESEEVSAIADRFGSDTTLNIVLAATLVGAAAYFIWTKLKDRQREAGLDD